MKSANWLEAAVRSSGSQLRAEDPKGVHTTDLAQLCPGDIWIVHAASGSSTLRRSVLVLDADQRTGSIHIALMSNQTDLATDDDLVLEPSRTLAPYRLMVETGLHTKLDWRQAETRIGTISDELLDMILDFIWDDRPDALEELRGLPYPDRTQEPLLAFQEEEVKEFRELTGDDVTEAHNDTPAGLKLLDCSLLNVLSGPIESSAGFDVVADWRDLCEGRLVACFLGFDAAHHQSVIHADPSEIRELKDLWTLSQPYLANTFAMNLLSAATVTEPLSPYGDSGICSLTMPVGERRQAQSVFVSYRGPCTDGPAGVFQDGALLFLDNCCE
jgi:hypothetical protein